MMSLHVDLHFGQDLFQLTNVFDYLSDFLLVNHCLAQLKLHGWHALVLCGRHVCQLNGVGFSVTEFS